MKPLLSSPAFGFFCHGFGLKKGEFQTLSNEEQDIVIKEFMNSRTQKNRIERACKELFSETYCESERNDETMEMASLR